MKKARQFIAGLFYSEAGSVRELEINNIPDTKNVGWVERSVTHRTSVLGGIFQSRRDE
ncbi:Uncharacterized protein dnm_043460 [Desulfonema magnum]|uniref:Uncharacterized protein n=1 Tax=Desulfonema magnum TaxID=45655 RepID=A0A975GPV7_9BACT|nr:Uncharacterized protein dnm_043460 [Desulfonema magnum]